MLHCESSGRFVLQEPKALPCWGYLPACVPPGGDRACSAPILYLACPSVGLAPTRAALTKSYVILASGQGPTGAWSLRSG